jgi:membrane protein implicated in regulation of membrane protease activity
MGSWWSGSFFCSITAFQAWLWGIHQKPSTTAIFWLSIEALFFAAYAVVATALGYRATERVETAVVENIENVRERGGGQG